MAEYGAAGYRLTSETSTFQASDATMASIEDLIITELTGTLAPSLRQCWETAILKSVASVAVQQIDTQSYEFKSLWKKLDLPVPRFDLIKGTPLQSMCIEELLSNGKDDYILKSLNKAIMSNRYGAVSKNTLKKKLNLVLPNMLNSPIYNQVFTDNPFPAAWKFLGNELAQSLYYDVKTNQRIPEWHLLNQLLLISYFHTCNLPTAGHVEANFRIMSRDILQLRGTLLRIPTRLGQDVVLDYPPPRSISSELTRPNLRHSSWSELQGHVQYQCEQIENGKGVLHQILNTNAVSKDARAIGLPDAYMIALRDADYREHEYEILTYMSLSAIEQLLRAWASHLGISHIRGSQPLSPSNWRKKLPISNSLNRALDVFYLTENANLRNRIMHGGLFSHISKRQEVSLATCNSLGLPGPKINIASDVYSTINLALLCLEGLILLDQEIINNGVSLTVADRIWEKQISLSESDADFGCSVYCDFRNADALGFQKRLSAYLLSFAPVLWDYFNIGFHGWNSSNWTDRSFVQHMCLGMLFEGIYRLTLHMMSVTTLRQSWENEVLHFEYRVIDDRGPESLASPGVVERLLAHLPKEERALAHRVLMSAIKIRNALAHGAVSLPDIKRWKGEGHILIKAIQLLESAGLHHMKQEAAYYRSQKRKPANGLAPLDDWLGAEKEIMELLNKRLSHH